MHVFRIEKPELAEAERMLGRPYRLSGVVQRGDGRGRGIGFPTANIASIETVIPATGVYAATAQQPDGSRRAAAVNIGHLPTVGDDRPLTVEAHVLDWQGDCYEQVLSLDLHQRLRGEQKFASLDELVTQITADVANTRKLVRV